MLKAIICDLDDTLYPETAYIFSGFRAVAYWADQHVGIPFEQGYTQLRQLFYDGVRGSTFNRWLAHYQSEDEELVRNLVEVYRHHQPELSLYPDVYETLQTVRKYFRLGLVSDGYLAVQQRKWNALGLNMLFSAVVFSDLWGQAYWKPHTRPFQTVLQMCGSKSSEAVYIGDNPSKDFFGANQLGIYTIRIRRPDGLYCHTEPLSSEYAAQFEIDDFTRLTDRILRAYP